MRMLLLLSVLLFLGGIAAACAFWAGADAGAPVAFACGGGLLAIITPTLIGQWGNWGVPGDEPRLAWRRGH